MGRGFGDYCKTCNGKVLFGRHICPEIAMAEEEKQRKREKLMDKASQSGTGEASTPTSVARNVVELSIERFGDLDSNFLIELKDDVPSDDDWDKAKTFCILLKTFYNVTKRLSGSIYVTANSYFHDVLCIQSTIKTWANSYDIMLQTMAKSMKAKFDKYWGDLSKVNMMLLIAVVLDPRFKLLYVSFLYEETYAKEDVR